MTFTLTRPLLFGALAVLAVAALSVLAPPSPADAQEDDGHSEQVQVRAQRQADGDIEFGLRTSEGNVLPRQRVFSARIDDERWRVSSPLELVNGTEVNIIARRDGDTQVEFGVRTVDPREEYFPSRRFFPRSTAVGRWLISTPVSIPAPEPQAEPEEQASGSQPSEPEQSGDSTESVEHISGGPRDGLIVEGNIVGDPDAPVLIVEYGDPF